MNPNNSSDFVSPITGQRLNLTSLSFCPKCNARALEVHGMRGEDDYGQLEGEQVLCHQCGFEDQWCGRC